MTSFKYPSLFFVKSVCKTIITCFALWCMCGVLPAADTNTPKAVEHGSMKPVPVASTNITAAALPKLVDLGAKKCIPCKKLAPILEELEKEYAGVLTVVFIDIWLPENKGKAEKYGIDTIPTQIFYDPQGKELWRHVGFISKEDILTKWKKLGYELKPKDENKGKEKRPATSKQ
jgi:thioredoxin 1